MPLESQFLHHGEPVETREQWATRQSAEAAARARAQEEAMRHAAEVARARVEAQKAEAIRNVEPPPAPASTREAEARPGKPIPWRTAAVLMFACAIAVFVVAGRSSQAPPEASQSPPSGPPEVAVVVPKVVAAVPERKPPVPTPARSKFLASPYGGAFATKPGAIQDDDAPDIWGGLNNRSPWADAPTIAPQSDGWWCVCYKTLAGDERTACRRLRSECVALHDMIQTKGSTSILMGSATPGMCRYVPGAYPWFRLGHRSAWMPSTYSGATQARDACAL